MHSILSAIRLLAGGAIVALALYALAAAPGLLSDRASTVPTPVVNEVRR